MATSRTQLSSALVLCPVPNL